MLGAERGKRRRRVRRGKAEKEREGLHRVHPDRVGVNAGRRVHREEKTKSKDAKNAIQENGVPGKAKRAA
jgi:hypothetical protein